VVGIEHRDSEGNLCDTPYLNFIINLAQEGAEGQRRLDNAKKERARKRSSVVCGEPGCKTRAHPLFITGGVDHCWKHGDSSKKKCKNCDNVRTKKGGYCHGCFEKIMAPKVISGPYSGMCKLCNIRQAVRFGGRCHHCVA